VGSVIVGTPDIGAYEYVGDSASVDHRLDISAINGAVNKSPHKTVYDSGETVTLQAEADDGYVFVGWAGDLSGSANPTDIVMDDHKLVTARFAELSAPDTYGLYTLSTNGGSVSRVPDKTVFASGDSVMLQAVPFDGFVFTGWSGALSGTSNPTTVVMDGTKLITANFALTYTLTTSATHGSITRTPSKLAYVEGETVTLAASPEAGYVFTGWSGDLSGDSNPVTITMDADKDVTAAFSSTVAPTVMDCSPEPNAIQVPVNSLVTLHVRDEDPGVDANTVRIGIDGVTVYSGNVASYNSAVGVCRRTGTKADHGYAYQSNTDFDFDKAVNVVVSAADLAGNAMTPYSYSLRTEMRAFGANELVSWSPYDLDKGTPATVCDSEGNIWAVWHAGVLGARDIYVSRKAYDALDFGDPVRLTTDASDQSDPDIAVGTDDKLYVTWQDRRRGNWDIYVSTSVDGAAWSAETRVTDSNDNQVNPAIVVDSDVTNRAYIAWQDDSAGHQDIYVGSSTTDFANDVTVSQVTSDASDQTDPATAVDAANTVYVVWTDRRSGSDDIYGAASNDGPWTNVPVVTGAGSQTSARVAAEASGSTLHFVWVDDVAGDYDIYYASSEMLPVAPLTGTNIVDDTSGADQTSPVIATVVDAVTGPQVFACWQDWRNVTATGGDADLYFVDIQAGGGTNILVGDDRTGSDQSEPALGIDVHGYPYVIWTDARDNYANIYYAGSTFMNPYVVDCEVVTATADHTVGIVPPSGLDDVSVVIPAGASPHDVTVTVTKIQNPPLLSSSNVLGYDFGPSGLEFSAPVTITIPYVVADYGGTPPVPCWYDSQTATASQEGITEIEILEISDVVSALQFKTTHFTPYYLVDSPVVASGGGGGGGGGGGCALAPMGYGGGISFFLPYAALAVVMVALRLRDRKAFGPKAPEE